MAPVLSRCVVWCPVGNRRTILCMMRLAYSADTLRRSLSVPFCTCDRFVDCSQGARNARKPVYVALHSLFTSLLNIPVQFRDSPLGRVSEVRSGSVSENQFELQFGPNFLKGEAVGRNGIRLEIRRAVDKCKHKNEANRKGSPRRVFMLGISPFRLRAYLTSGLVQWRRLSCPLSQLFRDVV